jgi:hypothetical protein
MLVDGARSRNPELLNELGIQELWTWPGCPAQVTDGTEMTVDHEVKTMGAN